MMETKKTTIEIPFGMFQEFLEYDARVKAAKALIEADGGMYSREAVASIVGASLNQHKQVSGSEEELWQQ